MSYFLYSGVSLAKQSKILIITQTSPKIEEFFLTQRSFRTFNHNKKVCTLEIHQIIFASLFGLTPK
jgi:hypothetical protein